VEGADVDERVQRRQRVDPIGIADRPLEPDRSADVVDHEVDPVELECVDRLAEPAREAGPRVVEVGRALRQPEAGKVEGDPPAALVGELGKNLAVEVGARWDAVDEDDHRPLAALAYETAHAAGVEPAPGGAVRLDQVRDRGLHV
jgi:hypothetical protein